MAKATGVQGKAVAPCQLEHGVADEQGHLQAKLAVESRIFPLLVYDPSRGKRMRDCLSLQGNPAAKDDWYVDPHQQQTGGLCFVRQDGRPVCTPL